METTFFKKYLFIWLHQVLVVAGGIFSCSMWDLVSWPRIKLKPPALATQSVSHWTARETPPSLASFYPSVQPTVASPWQRDFIGFITYHMDGYPSNKLTLETQFPFPPIQSQKNDTKFRNRYFNMKLLSPCFEWAYLPFAWPGIVQSNKRSLTMV